MTSEWSKGWRLSGKYPRDWIRHVWCLVVGHDWQINSRETQRSCLRCWWIQDLRRVGGVR